jgi:hypothetical protein
MLISYFTYVRRAINLLSTYCDAGKKINPAGTSVHGKQHFVLLFYGTQYLRQQLQGYADSVDVIYNPLTGFIYSKYKSNILEFRSQLLFYVRELKMLNLSPSKDFDFNAVPVGLLRCVELVSLYSFIGV